MEAFSGKNFGTSASSWLKAQAERANALRRRLGKQSATLLLVPVPKDFEWGDELGLTLCDRDANFLEVHLEVIDSVEYRVYARPTLRSSIIVEDGVVFTVDLNGLVTGFTAQKITRGEDQDGNVGLMVEYDFSRPFTVPEGDWREQMAAEAIVDRVIDLLMGRQIVTRK